MRSFRVLPMVLVVGVGLLWLPTSASASVINVSDNNAVLFYDDFESQAAGETSHIAYPDARGGLAAALPDSASVGTWSFTRNEDDWQSIQVTDYSDPGAAQGQKYLRLNRFGVYPLGAIAQLASVPSAGQHIRYEQMVNIAGDSGVAGQIVAYGSDGSVRINLLTNFGYPLTNYTSGPTDTGLSYSPGVWQKWQIDYVFGESSFALKIGNSDTKTLLTASSGDISRIYFTQEMGTGFYIDEVPEPSALMMLTAGLIGLLAYAWRKRT